MPTHPSRKDARVTETPRYPDPDRADAPQQRSGSAVQLFGVRLLVLLTLLAGVNYVAWRWLASLNWDAWWIAVPLVAAETYSLIDVLLFGMTVWRLKSAHTAGTGRPRTPRLTFSLRRTTSRWSW